MFVQDGARHAYPRPQRRRGWGRIAVLAAALLLVTGRLAYGSGPVASDRVVVAPGDTVWSIAVAHYRGDPRREPVGDAHPAAGPGAPAPARLRPEVAIYDEHIAGQSRLPGERV